MQKDEVYLKIGAPIDVLEKWAEKIHYEVEVDAKKLEAKMKAAAAAAGLEHWHIEKKTQGARFKPYKYQYAPFKQSDVALYRKQKVTKSAARADGAFP